MQKIIVTGHRGFIGTLLTGLLIEKGYSVTGIDCNYFGNDCNFYEDPYKKRVTSIIKDIRDVTAADLEGTYAVCHLAALSNDPMGDLNEDLTYDINHRASVKLARLAKEAGVKKFLYSSSCSLYGIAGDDAVKETADFSPITAYAKSKVYSEQDLLPMAGNDFCVTFLRNATAYGISPKLRIDLVVNNLVGWAVTQKKIRIMSDGSPWRPLVHAEDIARAFIAMIETDASIINGEAFNVGADTENYRVKDIAELIKNRIPECEIEITGEHGSDSRSYRVDFGKIRRMVPAFQPKWTLPDGISQVYEWYQKIGMSPEDFQSRKYIRLKQLDHLMKQGTINENLYFAT